MDAPSGPWSEADAHWMLQALEEAARAGARGEVPVGALVVQADRILGRACNATEGEQDPTAHAELLAIRQAARALGSRRLLGTSLYVTLEPCAMCAGAIVLARIPRLVFGAFDPKSGAGGSLHNLVQDPRLNHRCEVISGVLEAECGMQLRGFFGKLRAGRGV